MDITIRPTNVEDEILDSWLDSMGFFRKKMRNDNTSLFQALAEQLYGSHMHFQELITKSVNRAKKHKKLLAHLIPRKYDLFQRLRQVQNNEIFFSEFEVELVSKAMLIDVYVFSVKEKSVKEFKTNALYKDMTFVLCKTRTGRFDCVYPKELQDNPSMDRAEICQVSYEKMYTIIDQAKRVHLEPGKPFSYVKYCIAD